MKKPAAAVKKNRQLILTLIYSILLFSAYIFAAVRGARHLLPLGGVVIIVY